MKKALTDILVKAIKPPATGRIEVADTRCTGLELRVTSAGARSWSLRFRDPHSGRPARATIGGYPDVPLTKAREVAAQLRRQIADGNNPVTLKRQARAEADSKTFRALADRYLAEHARRFKRSADADERNLRLHILPAWADRPYDQISRRDVIALLERLVTSGKPVLANRAQALISSIFSFAIDADLVNANPVSRLRKRGVETQCTRVLTNDEVRLFWKHAVLSPVSRSVGLALRLALMTGMRAGEVAGLVRTEIDQLDDLEQAALTIRGERTKNGRTHFVPLAPLAVATLKEAIALSGDDDPVFGVAGHALAVAMRRMTDRLPDEPGSDTWRTDPPTPHDLRRTCATRLAGLGTAAEDVSAALNHVRADVTGRHYDQYARAKEKRIALNAWAEELEHILDPSQVKK